MIDLIGYIFGRLTVKQRVNNDKQNKPQWLCFCSCGNEKIVRGRNLRSGYTRSCGCWQKEKAKLSNTKHGNIINHKKSKIYRVWQSMKDRCLNPNNPAYKDYGGRNPSITVCERWLKFENFLKDIGEIPKGLTVDRINNDGNYSPDNYKFSTMKEQNTNKRNNIMISFNGKDMCLKDYCKIKNLKYSTVTNRINRSGWSIEDALKFNE